jgi:lipopolysaccharide/colanic/teichoic acid biosynthesis glycosyltransferase
MRSHSSKQASLSAPLRAAPGAASDSGTAPRPRRPADSATKRNFDIAAALALLIFFAPLMALIALTSWCAGGGVSAEDHVGVEGRVFRRLRFRVGPPFGRLLRCTGLDRLPQLLNVVAGQMSMVGPRALTAAELPRYGAALTDYQDCRPGITGLWQISGCNTGNYLHRVALDRSYARNWSFRTDLIILIRTPGQPLSR